MKTGKNQNSPAQIKSRKDFYDWLAQSIAIDGVLSVERDTTFDDVPNYRGAGIRLNYESVTEAMDGLREGVLLEVGFDTVAPNEPKDISSWMYDYAADKVDIIDNRAKAVPCYDPGYTFVEKLQTVSTKFRNQQANGSDPVEFMRHYYDIHELLQQPKVQEFIGTEPYKQHKKARFRQADNQNIAENEAFILSDAANRGERCQRRRLVARFARPQGPAGMNEIACVFGEPRLLLRGGIDHTIRRSKADHVGEMKLIERTFRRVRKGDLL
ncbi:nucleotidyl transferase AbiEii/AbiGii toxin family protein [Bradyrhizobium sp. SSUT77]|uniref:nucleotidyl transferase AbiEii/AbiGii toxin family protein n=1 Tax=Bradyrhizobium sp. SSUT77 TaxID=3040603 RepID=UPI002446F929|nr:nucleotidyl transferase AbiEii/AbiGii toxin family protein [Bradyrhizobium sp. SSUT77]MDH2347083.1 nucleotidyl transferase AbiEii/AbiGii toxin family protein [Bradyrhizobium sp. SSUT77]